MGIVLTLVYVGVILHITLFCRETSSLMRYDLSVLKDMGTNDRKNAYYIENILLFVPLGIFFPLIGKGWRNIFATVFFSFFVSFAVEFCQLFMKRGYAQVDDLLMNVLGGFLGWIIWGILFLPSLMMKKLDDDEEETNS